MIIGVDFDGTCVTQEYPAVGKEIGAAPVLKKLVELGHKIILFTMRGNIEGDLGEAIKWFTKNGIQLYGINKNPTQSEWTTSPKAYCNVYIDDAALGCPLTSNKELSDKPFVDWNQVTLMFNDLIFGKGIIGYTSLKQKDPIIKCYCCKCEQASFTNFYGRWLCPNCLKLAKRIKEKVLKEVENDKYQSKN